MKYHGLAKQGQVLVRSGGGQQSDVQGHPLSEDPFVSQTAAKLTFEVHGDGVFHTYYLPLWKHYRGLASQLRLLPVVGAGAQAGQAFQVDWVRVVRAPLITRVEGCLNKYYPDRHLGYGNASYRVVTHTVHRHHSQPTLQFHQTLSATASATASGGSGGNGGSDAAPRGLGGRSGSDGVYASTYNCLRSGGERLTITGVDFGAWEPSWAALTPSVTIGGKPCTDVVHTAAQTQLQCTTPAGVGLDREVTITNGALPGLSHTQPFLSYSVPVPAPPQPPTLSNTRSRALDVTWKPPVDHWQAITVTGYQLEVTGPDGLPYIASTVGNVTTTTIVGLAPSTEYRVRVAALTEDQDLTACLSNCRSGPDRTRTGRHWLHLDLYGRRTPTPGFLRSEFSPPSFAASTTHVDFEFTRFNANSTLNYGAFDSRTSHGPTGQYHGSGHYGLTLVGDAHVGGCNATASCCDGFGSGSGCSLVCTASPSPVTGVGQSSDVSRFIDQQTGRAFKTNLQGGGVTVMSAQYAPHRATSACGPSIRLTGPHPRQAGAMWYPRRQNVREGFVTDFTFRVSDPSLRCAFMNDEHTQCRSRGGDGFAFVVQTQSHTALGDNGMGLGYGGMNNSLAVEFDTQHNYELFDPWENHVSVHTRGWRHPNNPSHSYALGSTVRVPELTDGIHNVRISYSPTFDPDVLATDAFVASPHVSAFLENAGWGSGGQADWSTGMGTLSVFIDSTHEPLLVVPLNLDHALHLASGRAWVGFTAATGEDTYQVHDILTWSFRSTRQDPPDADPFVVSGAGAHTGCAVSSASGDCRHH